MRMTEAISQNIFLLSLKDKGVRTPRRLTADTVLWPLWPCTVCYGNDCLFVVEGKKIIDLVLVVWTPGQESWTL